MKKVQTQLKGVAKTLTSLADKLEKINAALAKGPAVKKAAPKKKAAAKKKAVTRKKAVAKKKAPAKKADKGSTVLDAVLDVIKKSRTGANIATLREKTKLESRQLSNALYKLNKKKMIKSKSRGVYIKA